MEKYKNLFGIDFEMNEMKTKDLPIYIVARRSFLRLSYLDFEFILIKVSPNEKFGVSAFEKQAKIVSSKYGMPVAFGFENITNRQRDSLIEKNIPFISDTGQLYLPFMGMALNNRFVRQKEIKIQKMMPVTQTLFLYLLYNSNGKPIMKKDAAESIGVTRTSITRASDQLAKMGLISQESYGKEYHMLTNGKGMHLFEMAKPYLINPIQQTITTTNDDRYSALPLSGESALAGCTMLNDPRIPVRAVYKADIDIEKTPEVDVRWEPERPAVKLEMWKYNPNLFEKNGIVDPVSLALCFEENADERIEEALDDYLEEYKW